VTGGTGFVGRRLVPRLLARGCAVAVLQRRGAPPRARTLPAGAAPVEGDFRDPASFAADLPWRPDALVHLAWHATTGDYQMSPANADDRLGSLRLFEAARGWGCRRIVGAGTCLEYGASEQPLAEDAPLDPPTPYAAAKAALFLALRASHQQFAWVRPFFVYGPGEDPSRFVPSVVRALLRGEPAETTSGEQRRDYLHVDDLAEAFALIATTDIEGAVNVGSGSAVPVRALALRIAALLGRPDLLRLGARARPVGDPDLIVADVARLRGLGWRPTVGLEEGLRGTIDWWRAHERTG
jgi:nucleoside-diphosphate-sugar epimerase